MKSSVASRVDQTKSTGRILPTIRLKGASKSFRLVLLEKALGKKTAHSPEIKRILRTKYPPQILRIEKAEYDRLVHLERLLNEATPRLRSLLASQIDDFLQSKGLSGPRSDGYPNLDYISHELLWSLWSLGQTAIQIADLATNRRRHDAAQKSSVESFRR